MSARRTIPDIQSFTVVEPMIYAYDTPGVTYHDGWIKIGYTEKQTPEQRINNQVHTADIETRLLWKGFAKYTENSGDYFTDHDFHAFLEVEKGIERKNGENKKKEWFRIDKHTSRDYFDEFASRGTMRQQKEKLTYSLRQEQQAAVEMTKEYFAAGGEEFLWNAKPRFGKTLSSYDLIRQMNCTNVLIVTNRPSIANSWAEDFQKFMEWHDEYYFVSETDSLAGKPGVLSREEYLARIRSGQERGMIAFVSLQDMKGSVYFGTGQYDKLEWMSDHKNAAGNRVGIDFDLLIVDEAQEGVDTMKTERAFQHVVRKHTLYLSGTPFKALASARFAKDQIYNWSYADEQSAKAEWRDEAHNPYEALPRLAMYTYQMSNMVREQLSVGASISDDEEGTDYAFDLNEFFMTGENGKFVHEADVKRFLHTLVTGEKYPFSTYDLRQELSHTLWILNRIASVEALEKLLKNDEVFRDYHIVKAVGDGSTNTDEDEADTQAKKNFDKVKKAIATHDKTITLSVGQLTVGVTVPEWSGVLMLCNLKSPSSYMQAAFRAQNPCMLVKNGQPYRKETAYVFDFDPARTLIIFDEFANNLQADTASGYGTTEQRKENIRRLLNFFPVISEDEAGEMIELDAAAVLSIPRRLKCTEVVRRGFMCNYLFNIGNVFGAPAAIREIVEKLETAQEEKRKDNKEKLEELEGVSVNENGDVDIPEEIVIGRAQGMFGEKIYEETDRLIRDIPDFGGDMMVSEAVAEYASTKDDRRANDFRFDAVEQAINKVAQDVKETVKQAVDQAADEYEVRKGTKNRLERQIEREIDHSFEKARDDFRQQANIAHAELEQKRKSAETETQVKQAEEDFQKRMMETMSSLNQALEESIRTTMDEKPQEVIEHLERHKAEQKKRDVEEEVRAHLRGFSRTIPSFLMAYGDDGLTLANIDDYTEDDVFLEVTGITEEEFRFLRDGGDYENPETGEMEHFDGHLFDETVFNDSVKEFLKKREELADYFDESHTEDIFDYIPPQKTNQIFTPKWVVQKMVDQLEEQNPGCFDDPVHTFADLYIKSGLYITEIVKRLYNSPGIRQAYPDEKERLRHILREQVYGMAPTRIIYLIATNYILGFDEELKNESHNFVQADAAEAAKNGTLQELVDEKFG